MDAFRFNSGFRLTPGKGIGFSSIIGGFDPEAEALFARMSPEPDDARKILINDWIVGIKEDNAIASLAEMFDCIWFPANFSQQASNLNWVNSNHTLIPTNNPTYTIDRGYTGDALTKFLDTDYNPSTDSVNFLVENCSYGTYNRLNINAVQTSIGQNGSSFLIRPRQSNNLVFLISSSTPTITANSDSRGMLSASRINGTDQEGYRNGIELATTPSTAIGAFFNANFYLLGENDGGPVGAASANEIAFAYISSGNVNHLSLYNRTQTYMTAIGAQV